MVKSKTSSTKKQTSVANNVGMHDWIASLAKQVTTDSSATAQSNRTTTTKEERIQKRALKKAERQQRHEERKKPVEVEASASTAPTPRTRGGEPSHLAPHTRPRPRGGTTDSDEVRKRLKRIAQWISVLRKEHEATTTTPTATTTTESTSTGSSRKRTILYAPSAAQERVKRTRALNEANIQPRVSDYSGIGLARKSLYIPFQDPSHFPKLEQEFKEHIPGFFGRQRTKAMKRQLDGNMLWRQLAHHKGTLPKKFANLPPDERVQAMMDAGMI